MYRNRRFNRSDSGYNEPRMPERPPARRRHRLKELLEYLIITLVDNKDDVVVTERERQGKLYYGIKVAKSDMGKLLGRGGKTITTLRTLMRVAAAKVDADAIVDVVEEHEHEHQQEHEQDQDQDHEQDQDQDQDQDHEQDQDQDQEEA